MHTAKIIHQETRNVYMKQRNGLDRTLQRTWHEALIIF